MQVNTNTIIIHWKQWDWKSMLWVLFNSDYISDVANLPFMEWFERTNISSDRIFWNIHIQHKWIEKVCFLKDMWILETMEYSNKPWVVTFDEVWLNFNSKDWWSDKNKLLTKFFFIVRKYNLSSIYISQRFSSVPIDMRELADYIFLCQKISRKWKHPLFRITRQTVTAEWLLEFYDEYIFDMISYLQKREITYDTLESSIID